MKKTKNILFDRPKRLLAALMAVIMLFAAFGNIPLTAFAAGFDVSGSYVIDHEDGSFTLKVKGIASLTIKTGDMVDLICTDMAYDFTGVVFTTTAPFSGGGGMNQITFVAQSVFTIPVTGLEINISGISYLGFGLGDTMNLRITGDNSAYETIPVFRGQGPDETDISLALSASVTSFSPDWEGKLSNPATVRGLASAATYGDWEYEVSGGNATITGYTGSGGDLTVPGSLGGTTVTSIGLGAFEDCTGLTGITFPNSLTSIGEFAFTGCTKLTSVEFPDSLESISRGAFSETQLTSITIPASVKEIGLAAFGGIPTLKKAIFADGMTKIPINALSLASVTEVVIPNTVTSIGAYAFYSCTKLTSITLPDSLKEIGDNAFDGCSGLTNVMLPGTVTKIGFGAFANCLELKSVYIPPSAIDISATAFFNVHPGFVILGQSGSYAQQYADSYGFSFAHYGYYISLFADPFTNKADINIFGYTEAGSVVKVYDGITLLGTFTADNAGKYGGTVTLTGFGTRTLRAEMTGSLGTITASAIITYEQSATVLSIFKLYHDGQTADLMAGGSRQILIFDAWQPFTFEVKISNSDKVKELFIGSERDGELKRMRAYYDPNKDIWIASGYFDPDDKAYVPGILSVRIPDYQVFEMPQFAFNHEIDTSGVELTPAWENATYEYLRNEPDDMSVQITLANEAKSKISYSVKNEEIKGATAKSLLDQGFEELTDTNGTTVFAKITPKSDKNLSFRMEIYQPLSGSSSPLFSQMSLSPLASGSGWTNEDYLEAIDWFKTGVDVGTDIADISSSTLPVVGFGVDVVLDGLSMMENMKKCENPYRKAAEAGLFGAKVGVGALALGIALTGGVGIIVAVGVTLTSVAVKKGMEYVVRENVPCDKSLGEGRLIFAIDPSGYIYEVVPGNRLPGVKVTVYYSETSDGANPVLWDAEEWKQLNPLITDFEGRYAWDVPEGWWQVKAEMDGYEPAYSEWLPVPPPQLDVNLGLVSYALPVIKYVNAYEEAIEIFFSKYMDIDTLTTANIIVSTDGNLISGRIEFTNEEYDYNETRRFASVIRFIPDTSLSIGAAVELFVDRNVKSYAGVNMQDDYKETATVKPEIKQINAENLTLDYGESGCITVIFSPAESAAGMKVLAQSDNPFIISVLDAVVDGDGTAKIPVECLLPGVANITLTLEGTTLQTKVALNAIIPLALTKLNNPTASVPSGEVPYGTELELFSDMPGAAIYYTTDGTCPRSSSTRILYAAPIALTTDVTIHVVAEKDGFDKSDVMIFTYTVSGEGNENHTQDPPKPNNGWWITLICLSSGLLIVAGFAVYWFAIKKKNFADLKAVFNKKQKRDK